METRGDFGPDKSPASGLSVGKCENYGTGAGRSPSVSWRYRLTRGTRTGAATGDEKRDAVAKVLKLVEG